jgi:hypothetical protein
MDRPEAFAPDSGHGGLPHRQLSQATVSQGRLVSGPAGQPPRPAKPSPGGERDETPPLEVIFTPAEPVLDPSTAKALLDLLLHAHQTARASQRPG